MPSAQLGWDVMQRVPEHCRSVPVALQGPGPPQHRFAQQGRCITSSDSLSPFKKLEEKKKKTLKNPTKNTPQSL